MISPSHTAVPTQPYSEANTKTVLCETKPKTNNVVERYDNIRASAGGNVPASLSVSVTAPESISLVTGL